MATSTTENQATGPSDGELRQRVREGLGSGKLFRVDQTWPHLASRVVFLTSGVPSSALDVFSGGARVPILRKPFNPEALQQLVERMLDQES